MWAFSFIIIGMKITRPEPLFELPESARCVHSGVLFEVWQWDQELYDGTSAVFERIKRPDTVVTFPVLEDGSIILTKQIQPGRKGVYIAGAGGRIDKGESVLETAKRELLEETGLAARDWVLWLSKQVTAKMDWVVYVLVAQGCTRVLEPKLDAGEKIETISLDFESFLKTTLTDSFSETEILRDIARAASDENEKRRIHDLFYGDSHDFIEA